MSQPQRTLLALLFLAGFTHATASLAIVGGQVYNFEDGTTQGWVVGLLGTPSPVPPVNMATGGPLGAGDSFLQLSSLGGGGPGSRLVAINVGQWTGDYTAGGITGIAMDLRNLGATDLSVRLYLENPMGAPATADAVTSAFDLPAGGGWMHAQFAIDALSLTALHGDVNTLLSNVTALRIVHSPTAAFPGQAMLGTLGVDNVTALPVPEPSTFALSALGLAGLLAWRQRRSTSARARTE